MVRRDGGKPPRRLIRDAAQISAGVNEANRLRLFEEANMLRVLREADILRVFKNRTKCGSINKRTCCHVSDVLPAVNYFFAIKQSPLKRDTWDFLNNIHE